MKMIEIWLFQFGFFHSIHSLSEGENFEPKLIKFQLFWNLL